jgi:plastocyanin
MSEFRKRVWQPVSLPIYAALSIAILVGSASRILLAVEEAASTLIALVLAAEILGICAVIAAGVKLKNVQRIVLTVAGLSLLGGGVAGAVMGTRPIEAEAEEVIVAAKGIAFTTKEVHFKPDAPFTLVFKNDDAGIPHNVDVFSDASKSTSLFKSGAPINGVATQAVEVEPLKAGTYPFICDVHPNMTGTLVPEGAEGEGTEPEETNEPTSPPSATPITSPSLSPTTPASGAPTTTDVVTKSDQKFEVDEFTLAAGAADTINFANQHTAPHNISIYAKADYSGEPIFKGDFVDPGTTKAYTFTGPSAGTYYFRCDIHPVMTGKAIFK